MCAECCAHHSNDTDCLLTFVESQGHKHLMEALSLHVTTVSVVESLLVPVVIIPVETMLGLFRGSEVSIPSLWPRILSFVELVVLLVACAGVSGPEAFMSLLLDCLRHHMSVNPRVVHFLSVILQRCFKFSRLSSSDPLIPPPSFEG